MVTGALISMKIIFASAIFQSQYGFLNDTENILETWHNCKPGSDLYKWLQDEKKPEWLMLLDSAAFSVWTRGLTLDLDEYADYCHQAFEDGIITAAASVDVIPGEFGRVPSPEEAIASASKGWENYLYLVEERKLPTHKMLHIFHQGEDIKWLETLMQYNDDYVKSGGDPLYIGLSPANDRTTKQKALWLDKIMPYLTNSDGSAKVKWHGFGVTAVDLMKRYPWFTVDSTAWMRAGAYGAVKVPQFSKAHPYLDSKLIVSVTEGTGMSQANKHYSSFSAREQRAVRDYLKSIGLSIEAVGQDEKEGVAARQKANIIFWKRMEKELQTVDNRWKPIQPSFI